MEVEFVLTVKSICFCKNHHFYVESAAHIFKMEVESPINKDKMVVLFFGLRTSKTYGHILVYFCMSCRVRSPMVRVNLEIKCYLQSRFPLILYATTHATL